MNPDGRKTCYVSLEDMMTERDQIRNLRAAIYQLSDKTEYDKTGLLKKIDDRVKAFVQRYCRVYQEIWRSKSETKYVLHSTFCHSDFWH